MAATFLQALKERYEAVQVAGGLPTMGDTAWVGAIPENKARSLADGNVLCRPRGQVPQHQGDNDTHDVGKADFEVYRVGLTNAEATALAIRAAFTRRCLAVEGKDVALYLMNYLPEEHWLRGPNGEFVFKVTLSYMAEITNTMAHGRKGNLPSR